MKHLARRLGWKVLVGIVLAVLVAIALIVFVYVPSLPKLLVQGDERDLRPGEEPVSRPGAPSMLILALDGVDRSLLYAMLRRNELPELATLLGGSEQGRLPHAHLDETLLAPMPTMTLASWATLFTGTPPAQHGVVGNEYFVREERRYVGPGPVSVAAPDLVLQVYTDGYANRLLNAPTIYERLRERDPNFTSWVALSQFYRGADRLILADRAVLGDAFAAMLDADDDADDLEMFASLDREVVDSICDQLKASPAPRLLTVYLAGADAYGHGSDRGPDDARREYLVKVLEPLLAKLRAELELQGALANRHVLVLSDHGQLEVLHDDVHALSTTGSDDPPAILRAAGFRLRPFEEKVPADHDFDSVLAYGGAIAYGYIADRSSCPRSGVACDWTRPPRFREDVVPFVDALRAGLGDRLDVVFVRKPDDAPGRGPFEVYLGNGKTMPVDAYLAREPRAQYVDVERRLRELAVGPRGHHAGDVLLLARNGNEDAKENRYYFSDLYHGWHGSPSRSDSEIPLIVAHPRRTAATLAARVRAIAGDRVDATEVAEIIEGLLFENVSTHTRAR